MDSILLSTWFHVHIKTVLRKFEQIQLCCNFEPCTCADHRIKRHDLFHLHIHWTTSHVNSKFWLTHLKQFTGFSHFVNWYYLFLFEKIFQTASKGCTLSILWTHGWHGSLDSWPFWAKFGSLIHWLHNLCCCPWHTVILNCWDIISNSPFHLQ